jgi:hypothetical protein
MQSKVDILYLAYVEPRYKQLFKKINGQVAALNKLGINVRAIAIGKNLKQQNNFLFKTIDISTTKLKRHEVVKELIDQYKPINIYFRYPNGYNDVLQPLIPLAEKYKNFFFESNTREEDELKTSGNFKVLKQEVEFGRKLIQKAAGIIGMTNSFSNHQMERVPGLTTPVTTIANGITVNDFPLASQPELNKELVLLFVGYIAIHHAIDRVIRGLVDYNGNMDVTFYVAGKFFNNDYKIQMENLLKTTPQNINIQFLGELDSLELNQYYNQAHICVGSLGMHRIDSLEGASLKTREYFARGKAVIIDHLDTDAKGQDFVMKIPADESNLNIEDVINFVKSLGKNIAIRKFAENNVDWIVKMKKLMEFINSKNKSITSDVETIIFPVKNDFQKNYYAFKHLNNINIDIRIILIDLNCKGRNKELLYSLSGDIVILEAGNNYNLHEICREHVKGKYLIIDSNFNGLTSNNSLIFENYNLKNSRKFFNKESFQKYYTEVKEQRLSFEKQLAVDHENKIFYHKGVCCICGGEHLFKVDWILVYNGIPGYRERLICDSCGLSARKRVVAGLVKAAFQDMNNRDLFCFEQKGKFYKTIKAINGLNVIGSEFLSDDLKPGTIFNGFRHENATNLSFRDKSFDLIVSNDVFEHVPDISKALQECFRVLKDNGKLIFTVPFSWKTDISIQRAKIENGKLIHILDPHFHKDPLRKEGALVFYDYGWDILDFIRNAGFKKSYIEDFYDISKGQFGDGKTLVFIAEK